MNKQTIKRLKSFASILPPSYYEGNDYHKKDLLDLREKEIKNSVMSVDTVDQSLNISGETKPVQVKRPTLFPINHERRIKAAYIRGGDQAVIDYFEWVDNNNKRLNMKYNMKLITNVLTEKVKASINSFM
jgi:hypothetical protein